MNFLQHKYSSGTGSVVAVLVQNFLFCTAIAVILRVVVPSVGQYGFYAVFVHSQAIGFSITLLAIAISAILAHFGVRNNFARAATVIAVTPAGLYAGLFLASWWLDIPDSETARQTQPSQFTVSAVTAIVASLLFNWHLANREKILRLQLKASEQKHRAESARLAMLRAQLDPHMLFNTLANLRALINTDQHRAVDMLDQLDSFLRATLNASRNLSTSLEKEYHVIESYLKLMQIRLGDRLQFQLDLPEDCQRASIPALLLQPLIENAIRHGIEPEINGGKIEISARREQNTLALTVADNGTGFTDLPVRLTEAVGMPDDRKDHLPGNAGTSTGFGLQNIVNRLKETYAEDAQFDIQSTGLHHGTRVTIRIPFNQHTEPN